MIPFWSPTMGMQPSLVWSLVLVLLLLVSSSVNTISVASTSERFFPRSPWPWSGQIHVLTHFFESILSDPIQNVTAIPFQFWPAWKTFMDTHLFIKGFNLSRKVFQRHLWALFLRNWLESHPFRDHAVTTIMIDSSEQTWPLPLNSRRSGQRACVFHANLIHVL